MKKIRTIFSWEQRLALQHLCEDTSRTPDIYRDIVFLPREHDLRSSIVSRRNIASHLRILNTGETKVADLQSKKQMGGNDDRQNDVCGKYEWLRTLRSQFSLIRMLLGFYKGQSSATGQWVR